MRARAWFAAGLLGAWAIGIGVFTQREVSRPAADRMAEVAMRVAPGATWLAVERDGRHVGFASVTIDTVPRELQFIEYLVTDDARSSGVRRLVEQTTIRLSRGLALRGFETVRVSGADSTIRRARVDGDSTLTIDFPQSARLTAEGSGAQTVAIRPPLLLPALVPLVAALQAPLEVGGSASYSVFDTASASVTQLPVRVDAESLFVVVDSAVAGRAGGRWLAVHRDTVRAWRLRSLNAQVPMDVWVDALGRLVAATRPDGLVLRRTAFELAFENWRLAAAAGGVAARPGGLVVSGTLLQAGARFPSRTLDSLRLRPRTPVSRADASRAGLRFRGGADWTAARPTPRVVIPRYSLPVNDPAWRRGFHRNLVAEPGIEVDDPGIQALARRLGGTESDPLSVTESTLRWMRDSVRVEPGPAAGAAEVRARRRGDANEFARLFTALLRANGIPARTVAGLLFADGRLYHHAWSEVYLDGWVEVDAMLGQFPADGAHLSLVRDTLDSQGELMRLLARLDLRVVGAWGPAATADAERTPPGDP